jgi:drug/metabolite transporter (DMT)-like permease
MAAAPTRQDAVLNGILLRCLAAGCFSIMSALLKAAGDAGVAAPEMLFWRATFGLPVVLGWVMLGPGLAALSTRRPLAHVGRTALGITSILFTFQALILLPLAEAVAIGFTAPIFATILSAALLGEEVGRYRWAAVAIGFLGVVIVMRPGGSSEAVPLIGAVVALVSAFGTASVTVTIRQIGTTENVAAIVFWFFAGSALVGGALLTVWGQWHGPATVALLAGGGVAGGFAQIAMTSSLRLAPVAVLSPFDYLQMVGALLLGWLLLASTPTVNTLAGAGLIAASGLFTAWREHCRRRERPVPATQAVG